MFARQRGATFIGMLIIGVILGAGLYMAIRLVPVYFEYMEVVRAMEQTAKEHAGNATNPQDLRNSLDRRWTVEDIKSISPKQMEIKRAGGGYSMRAAYRAEVPFIANIALVAAFDKSVDVRGPQ